MSGDFAYEPICLIEFGEGRRSPNVKGDAACWCMQTHRGE